MPSLCPPVHLLSVPVPSPWEGEGASTCHLIPTSLTITLRRTQGGSRPHGAKAALGLGRGPWGARLPLGS